MTGFRRCPDGVVGVYTKADIAFLQNPRSSDSAIETRGAELSQTNSIAFETDDLLCLKLTAEC